MLKRPLEKDDDVIESIKRIKIENTNDDNIYKKQLSSTEIKYINDYCKKNNGFYDNKTDLLYNEMNDFILSKLSYLYLKNDEIRFLNYINFYNKNGKSIVINKNDKVLYIILFTITKSKESFYLTLVRWFKLDKNVDIIDFNIIITQDLNTIIIQQQQQQPKKEEPEKEEEEINIEIDNIFFLYDRNGKEIPEPFTLTLYQDYLFNYLIYFNEIMLLQIKTGFIINKGVCNEYLKIKKSLDYHHDINIGRILYITVTILLDTTFLEKNYNKKLTNEIHKILIGIQKPSYYLGYNINDISSYIPVINNWLNFEEYLMRLEYYLIEPKLIINYTRNLISIIKENLEFKISHFKLYIHHELVKTLLNDFIDNNLFDLLKLIILTKYNNVLLVKINFLCFINIINKFSKSSFSLKILIDPEYEEEEEKWVGLINEGFIYLTPKTFLNEFMPKLQRWLTYFDFLLKLLCWIMNPLKDQRLLDFYPKKLRESFFANNNIYTQRHIINNLILLKPYQTGRIIEDLSKINLNKNLSKNNKNFEINDIEDLILPPCIKESQNKYLKNLDRLTITTQFSNLGIGEEDLEKIYKDNKSLPQLKTQFKSQHNKSNTFGCKNIFNSKGLIGFQCPYSIEFDKKKIGNFDSNEKKEILSKCRKEHKSDHHSPAELIIHLSMSKKK